MVTLASDKLLILEAEPPPDRLFIWVWIEEVTPARYPISVAEAPATLAVLAVIAAAWLLVIPS